jgi:hypothetical protein
LAIFLSTPPPPNYSAPASQVPAAAVAAAAGKDTLQNNNKSERLSTSWTYLFTHQVPKCINEMQLCGGQHTLGSGQLV